MPDDPRRVYWDANVPLSYLNGVPDRVPILDELFRKARAGEIELVTSAISRVEIAFIQSERDAGTLDQETEDAIDLSGRRGRRSRQSSSTTSLETRRGRL